MTKINFEELEAMAAVAKEMAADNKSRAEELRKAEKERRKAEEIRLSTILWDFLESYDDLKGADGGAQEAVLQQIKLITGFPFQKERDPHDAAPFRWYASSKRGQNFFAWNRVRREKSLQTRK